MRRRSKKLLRLRIEALRVECELLRREVEIARSNLLSYMNANDINDAIRRDIE